MPRRTSASCCRSTGGSRRSMPRPFSGTATVITITTTFIRSTTSFDTNSAMTAMVGGRPAPREVARRADRAEGGLYRFEAWNRCRTSTPRSTETIRRWYPPEYRLLAHASVFGEYAWYNWGLMNTSAGLIDLPELDSVDKNGFYAGRRRQRADSGGRRFAIGTTITREVLDRDDSLIKYLWLQNLYGVTPRREREIDGLSLLPGYHPPACA